jgi:uncharacterized repeat protein (TIGR04076 family)
VSSEISGLFQKSLIIHWKKMEEGGSLMANPEKVILKIVSVKGTCAAGHHVGQEFDLSKDFLLGLSGDPRAICPAAFHAVFPSWRVLRHGGEYPWEEDRDKTTIACPDPINPVVMELRRVRAKRPVWTKGEG